MLCAGRSFNETFNEFYQLKRREIEHIHDKAKRIAEIQAELRQENPIYRPQLLPEEVPESILTVLDSEGSPACCFNVTCG